MKKTSFVALALTLSLSAMAQEKRSSARLFHPQLRKPFRHKQPPFAVSRKKKKMDKRFTKQK